MSLLTLQINLDEFRGLDYNLRGRLGDLLRAEYKFDTYDGIKEAYNAAFGRYHDSLNTESDRSLFNLAQTRNVIVHSASRADGPFIRTMVDTQSALPEFKALRKNDPIPIDGELTAKIVNDSIASTARLIQEIDALL